MELQEAIRLAEQGNVNMMYALGKYYSEKEEDQLQETGWMWYERAADAGHIDALPIVCQYYEQMARTSETFYGYTTALDYWRKAAHYANIYEQAGCAVMQQASIDPTNLIELASGIRYQFALCCFMADDYSDILQLYSHPETVEEKILYGVSLTQAIADNSWDERQVFQLLSCVSDISYSRKEKGTKEECVYTSAALTFSNLLRHGLGAPINLDAAYNVLSATLCSLKDSDCIEILKTELSHYQKKLFGGYKYID